MAAYAQEDDFQFIDEELPADFYGNGQYPDWVDDNDPEVTGEFLQDHDVLEIDLGIDHACALFAGGHIKCWGFNVSGQLGDGTTTEAHRPVDVVGISNAVSISAGSRHSCAVLDTGQISCWGGNQSGALGIPIATTGSLTPILVPDIDNAVEVVAGGAHTCAMLADGQVKCWGNNDFGQLGNGSTTPTSTPTLVEGIENAVMISSIYRHTCVGETQPYRRHFIIVSCWGRNNTAQAGDIGLGNILTPNVIAYRQHITDITAGISHTCYTSGTYWVPVCRGAGSSGQIGVGAPRDHGWGLMVGFEDVTHITAGRLHTCARTIDGFVRCWGGNRHGELGLGNYRADPATHKPHYPVFGLWGSALNVEAGRESSCAILIDRSVVCWGMNGFGQLGNGTLVNSNKPVRVLF